jgi:hypothetical protein
MLLLSSSHLLRAFGMRLYTQAPEIGVSCCSAENLFQPNSRFPQRWRIPTIGRDFPKEKAYWVFHVNQNGEKKELL